MTRAIAFAPIVRAARRAGAASCVLAAMPQAAAMSTRQPHVVAAVARCPGPGRS